MTTTNQTNKKYFSGDGVTDTVTFVFRALATSDIKVYVYPQDLTDFTALADYLVSENNYTITLSEDGEGGEVVFDPSFIPAADEEGVIRNEPEFIQTADLPTEGNFNEQAVETALDRITLLTIQLLERANRGVFLSSADPLAADENFIGLQISPEATLDRAGKALQFNEDGTLLESGPTSTEIAGAQQAAEDAEEARDDSQAIAENVALTAVQIQSYVEAIAEILAGLEGGFGQVISQIYIDGIDFNDNVSTTIQFAGPILPPNKESIEVYFYGSPGNGVRIASNIYSYDANTGILTFVAPITTGTTQIMTTFITPLEIGVPALDSVDWLNNMIHTLDRALAGWDTNGEPVQYDFTDIVDGSSTDTEIPHALAVWEAIEDALTQAAIPGFDSGQIAVPSGIVVNVPHSLGATPKSVRLSIICKTAELGYAIDDVVFYGESAPSRERQTNPSSQINIGFTTGANATNVFIIRGSNAWYVMHKSTGVFSQIVNANWRLIVEASL